MDNSEKKIWLTGLVGFAVGVGATLTVLALCCCPMRHNYKHFAMAPAPIVEHQVADIGHKPMPMQHWKGNHRGIHGKHFKPTPEMKEKFAAKLGLTDEQKTKLEEMRKADMEKMEPLIEQMEELHLKMKELRQVNRQHFESVLTDAQKEILKDMRQKHFNAKHLL